MPTPRKSSDKDPFNRDTIKILLQGIDESGGLAVFRNKPGEKKQKLGPLLEELRVFGKKGDPKREQANQIYQYWYTTYFLTGNYDKLLSKYGIQSSIPLERIPSTPLFKVSSAKVVSREEYFSSLSPPFTPTIAAAPQSTPTTTKEKTTPTTTKEKTTTPTTTTTKEKTTTPTKTTKEKTTTPTTTTQTTGLEKMKTSHVAINLDNPEDNDNFYAWQEKSIELQGGTKQIDLISISVAILDIDDYTDNRYDAVLSASKTEVIVKIPKQAKYQYNSAARKTYNIKGHQLAARKMKEHVMNNRDDMICKKIHIKLNVEASIDYFNGNASSSLRPIKWLDRENAYPLVLHKDLAYGYFGASEDVVPKYSAVWRIGIKDTLQDLKPTNIDDLADRFAEIATDAEGPKKVVDEFANYKGAF
jgi:hypothetical protein